MRSIQPEVIRAVAWGIALTALTAILIVIGSRSLAHFDAALVGYTFAVLFSVFAIVYRYTMWLQRPPTALYWRRGWQVFFKRRYRLFNAKNWGLRVAQDFILNRFIMHRSRLRWLTHMFLMWGATLGFAITIPLVFGWLHFETVPGNMDLYHVFIFGFPTFIFPTASIVGFFIFHGLVWASFLTIAGVMLAMRRRMKDHGAASVQMFGEDLLPLILLFAVSITGLMLTASYSWMKGYGYDFIAILHAITVIFTLLWLPFGKFFHIFQRPARLGVSFYKDVGMREAMGHCRRCDAEFASQIHIDDLIVVEQQLGYSYQIADPRIEHYQNICPLCRRKMLALAQGKLWRGVAPD